MDIDWRGLLWLTSGLALIGAVIVRGFVRDGPYVADSAPFNPRAAFRVFTVRGARLATLGYLGHMWELYAMWTWFGTFAAASLAAAGSAPAGVQSLVVTFVAVASGAPGCVLAGLWGDRIGKARVAGAAMVVSALCAACAGLFFGASIWWLGILAVVWGFAVVADSAQFSALVSEHSRRDEVGTAVTVQTSLGFLLTMLTIRLVPAAAEWLGWAWVFLVLVPGPLAGAWAMRALAREPTS